MAQTLYHINRNTHVGGRKDVVQHQRTLDTVSQRFVILLHLRWRQRIVGWQCGNDDISTSSRVSICLLDLFRHTVTCQSCIDRDRSSCFRRWMTVRCFDCRLYEQQAISLGNRIALTSRSHQQR